MSRTSFSVFAPKTSKIGIASVNKLGKFCYNYFRSGEISNAINNNVLPGLAKRMQEINPKASEAVFSIGKGRICLFGEHNDHDLCQTLSVPMENGTICAAGTNVPGKIVLANMDGRFQTVEIGLPDLKVEKSQNPPWHYYPASCMLRFAEKFPQVKETIRQKGLTMIFDGREPYGVPVSSGLSSSAAIENATLIAFYNLLGYERFPNCDVFANHERQQLAEIAVSAENDIANCGRLDQHTSLAPAGRQGVKLDYWEMVRGEAFRWDKAYEFFDMPDELLLGVVSSDQPASTAQAGYRIRRLSGWAFSQSFFDQLVNNRHYLPFKNSAELFIKDRGLNKYAPCPRDVYQYARWINSEPLALWNMVVTNNTPRSLNGKDLITMVKKTSSGDEVLKIIAQDAGLDEKQISESGEKFLPQYGAYILSEEARVRRAYELLKEKDYRALGLLLSGTHFSMSDIYKAGTKKNTKIVNILAEVPGVIGSRIVGAGFGGYNMFMIHGATEQERDAFFFAAKTMLAANGFNTCYKALPGCGSAVFEAEN